MSVELRRLRSRKARDGNVLILHGVEGVACTGSRAAHPVSGRGAGSFYPAVTKSRRFPEGSGGFLDATGLFAAGIVMLMFVTYGSG